MTQRADRPAGEASRDPEPIRHPESPSHHAQSLSHHLEYREE
jgi:hypothetical protein